MIMPSGTSTVDPDTVSKSGRTDAIPPKPLAGEGGTMPVDLRDRVRFLAGVESARLLQDVQDKLLALVRLHREQLVRDRSADEGRNDFISGLRRLALSEGLQPSGESGKYGPVQGVAAPGRLALIHDCLAQGARGCAIEANLTGLNDALRGALQKFLGARGRIDGDKITWKGTVAP